MMYRLRVKTHFDAAHYIRDYQGKCSREHGHRWEVEVEVEGRELHGANMLIDFVLVKDALKALLDEKLDHYQLNEVLCEANVTAEFLAKWIYDRMLRIEYEKGLRLARVTVWESPDCCVEYRGDDE